VAVTLQQGWDFAIPMSPHCSAIFLQHSRSADVMAALGNTHAATGSAASISARADTPTLVNSFNITSLRTADNKTQQAGKGFTVPVKYLSEGQLALNRVVTRDADRFPELVRQYQRNFARGRTGILIAYLRSACSSKSMGEEKCSTGGCSVRSPATRCLGEGPETLVMCQCLFEVDRSIFSDSVLGRTRLSESRQSFNQQFNSPVL
jgi:hypothetical protein